VTGGGDLGGGFRLIDEHRVFTGHLFGVAQLDLEDPDGGEFHRDVVRHPGAVAVVPLHADATVTLVRQLRPAVGTTVLEIPAGTCDVHGEALEVTARRELAEEAGLVATELRRLVTVFNSPGYSDQRTTVYLATGLSACQTARSGTEERWMSVESVPLDDVERLVAEGLLLDSTTLVGLLLTRAVLARGAVGG
jgi:ADP-ribose pyrophosphatase